MEIIPAIDVIGGKCVRLSQGDYNRQTTYFDDPAEFARRAADLGIRRLHLVDLDGAKASHPVNLKVLERIASTGMDIEFGGGIKSKESLDAVFSAGASRAICGSIAVTSPESFSEWLAEYGPAKMILGADIKDGLVAINGWYDRSELSAEELIEKFDGLSQIIITDISRDGMMSGPSFGLYERLQNRFPDKDIIVSGGVSSMDDIERLRQLGLRYAIAGKAIYEGKITLEDVSKANNSVS